MMTELYRKHVPANVRWQIYNHVLYHWLSWWRDPSAKAKDLAFRLHCLRRYAFSTPRTEWERTMRHIGLHGLSLYPFPHSKEYFRLPPCQVSHDPANGLPYVMHNGKRLYFKAGMIDGEVNFSYRGLCVEQGPRSAHRYVDSYDELDGKVLLDVGAAEAIFTLEVIERIRHAYVFECDPAWLEALEATFAPWRDKVTIVRQYVGDTDGDDSIRFDTFFADKPADNLFLKMDIEGSEQRALLGAEHLLATAPRLSGSVCVYHTHDAEQEITSMLHAHGLHTQITPGYLYFGNELRHGIARFTR